MELAVNYVAVVVAAVVSFVIGWAWYSPFGFVKQWLRARGKDPEKVMADMKNMSMPMGKMLAELIATLVVAYVLAHLSVLFGVQGWQSALQLAVWLWLGFQATLLFGQVLWEDMTWQHYAISAGRWLVSLVVISLVVGLWH